MKRMYAGIVLIMLIVSWVVAQPVLGAEKVKPITLKCSHAFSVKMDPIDVWLQWADEVTKRSEGRIKFQWFHGGSMSKPGEEQEHCRKGVVQMVASSATWHPTMPLWEMNGALPFQPSDTLLAVKTKWQLYQEFPELRKEIEDKNMRLMFIAPYGDFHIAARKTIEKLDDLAGLKIAILGQQQPKWFEGTGATTMFLPGPARYEALEKGVIDASLMGGLAGSFGFRYFEMCKHVLLPELGQYCSLFMAINQDTWNKIAPKDQKMIEELNQETMFKWFPERVSSSDSKVRKMSEKELGVSFYEMSDNDRKDWANSLPNLAQSWIDEAENSSDKELRKRMWLRNYELTTAGDYQWPMDWSNVK